MHKNLLLQQQENARYPGARLNESIIETGENQVPELDEFDQ